jgi:hypothetical protein
MRGAASRIIVASMLVAAGLVVATPLPAPAATSWNIVPSPNLTPVAQATVSGVACPSATLCFMVGSSGGINFPLLSSLIERWNGTAWSAVVSPEPAGAAEGALDGVSCAGVSNCFAVGYFAGAGRTRASLIKRWDGARWSNVAVPGHAGELTSVACASATMCFAVGGANGVGSVLRWNGATWSVVPGLPLGPNAEPEGVACSSVSNCFAVGSIAGSASPLTAHWNGTAWSVVANPAPTGAFSMQLLGVSCPDAATCFAVGLSGGKPLIERWDGSSWSLTATQGGDADLPLYLTGVACSSASSCFAVGPRSGGSAVIRWNGTDWSPVPGTDDGSLSAVACSSATDCAAAGASFTLTLAERWDGTSWSVVPSPTPVPPWDALLGVSCRTTVSCWAVGRYDTLEGDFDAGLIERWDGKSWKVVPDAPKNKSRLRRLVSVACESANRCFAVGSENYQDFESTMVLEHWDGARWSQVFPKTPVAPRSSDLSGVACASSTHCFAVGFYRLKGKDRTLVEGWDGKTWSQIASPNPANVGFDGFFGVACPGRRASRSGTRSCTVRRCRRWSGGGTARLGRSFRARIREARRRAS